MQTTLENYRTTQAKECMANTLYGTPKKTGEPEDRTPKDQRSEAIWRGLEHLGIRN
jgi:hypothetical protein